MSNAHDRLVFLSAVALASIIGCRTDKPSTQPEPTVTSEHRSTRIVTRRQATEPAPTSTAPTAPSAPPASAPEQSTEKQRASEQQPERPQLPPVPEEYADTVRQLEQNKREQLGLSQSQDLLDSLTLGDERELGRVVAASVASQGLDEKDEDLLSYVNLIAATIGTVSHRPELAIYVAILDDDGVNAFSVPGGYVFVTRGAIKAAHDEAELAAILAHEIAHLTLRHGVRSLAKDHYRVVAQTRTASMQEALGGAIDPELERELSAIADDFEAFMKQGYSRDLEHEADRVALLYLWRAGYQASALRDFLESLGQSPSGARALISHPPAEERAKLVEAEIAAAPELANGKRMKERFLTHTASLRGG